MISQYNVVYTVESLKRCIDFDDFVGKRAVSYLPMAHIAERMMSHYQGAILGYSRLLLPRPEPAHRVPQGGAPRDPVRRAPCVGEDLQRRQRRPRRPTPRRKAKFDEGVAAALADQAGRARRHRHQGAARHWAFLDAVAFANVRGLVGLDSVLQSASPARPPIPRPVLEWFNADRRAAQRDLRHERVERPDDVVARAPTGPAAVGQEIPGCEVRIADDGEVICRGGNVFQGYLKQPDKTAETLIDGWLHSGDIGEIDADGYVKIVDRKKELIITSGGKNISPANLEAALKTIPLIGQAAAIGDNRKFCSAILVLDPEAAAVWAREHGRSGRDGRRAGRRSRGARRGAGRRRRDQPAVRPGRADQEVRPRRRGVAARQRHAHADVEAEAPRRERPLRRRDRIDVRRARLTLDRSPRSAPPAPGRRSPVTLAPGQHQLVAVDGARPHRADRCGRGGTPVPPTAATRGAPPLGSVPATHICRSWTNTCDGVTSGASRPSVQLRPFVPDDGPSEQVRRARRQHQTPSRRRVTWHRPDHLVLGGEREA